MIQRDDPRHGYITLRHAGAGLDAEAVTAFLSELVSTDPRNALPEGHNLPIFEPPVVAIAAASDPLFEELQQPQAVGPLHVNPDYWLPDAKAVICFFLPFSQELRKTYERRSALPSLEWVSARQNGEVFVNVTRRALARFIERQGGNAAVPCLDLRYHTIGLVPNWSERHVGFVAGLGTFGRHAGLLTAKGTSGRLGSVVTDLPFRPTPRPYNDIYEYCLPGCKSCIRRCPVGAIDSQRIKDHMACAMNIGKNITPVYEEWGYRSCGHCQTYLPCVNGIPKRPRTAGNSA